MLGYVWGNHLSGQTFSPANSVLAKGGLRDRAGRRGLTIPGLSLQWGEPSHLAPSADTIKEPYLIVQRTVYTWNV